MKTVSDWRLWINVIPALAEIALFQMGIWYTLFVFPLLLIFFLLINSCTAKTVSRLWAQQAVMAAGLMVSGGVSTWLYYSSVSSDSGTPMAGMVCMLLAVSITLSSTFLATPFVVRKSRKQEECAAPSSASPSHAVRPENLFLTAAPKSSRQKVKEFVLILAGVAVLLAVTIGMMLLPGIILQDTYDRVIVPSGRYIAYDELQTCPIDISTETALYSWFDEYIDDDMLIELRRYMRENELYIQPNEYRLSRVRSFEDLKNRLRFEKAENVPEALREIASK